MTVQLSVVDTAHRDSELVTDFAPERARLGKAQMVGICGRTAAHQAGLGGDELAMVLVAQTDDLGRYPASAGSRLCLKRFWLWGAIAGFGFWGASGSSPG